MNILELSEQEIIRRNSLNELREMGICLLYTSFLKLHITNQRCILNKKLHSSNSNPGEFQEFNFGRSSDLLHFPNALPIPPKRNSGFEYCRKTFGGAYSSGSVQDLHLIPFSPLFP